MIRFLFLRLLHMLFVMAGVSTLVFLLIHFIPGDPVEVMLGETASFADRVSLRHDLHLDRPILAQFGIYLVQLSHFNLGESLYSKQAVTTLIAGKLFATLQLALASLLVALVIAVPLGTFSAVNQNRWPDYVSSGISLLGISIPNFVAGPILILIFALWLGWFPVSGRGGLASIVLPALTLGSAMAAILTRMLRSTLIEILTRPYVISARARGLSPAAIMFQHVYRNALLPIITLLGLQLGGLLAGAVITETIFSWPGIGQLTIDAIQKRDYPLVQGCVLMISFVYVLVNLFTDSLYAVIDPRIRAN